MQNFWERGKNTANKYVILQDLSAHDRIPYIGHRVGLHGYGLVFTLPMVSRLTIAFGSFLVTF